MLFESIFRMIDLCNFVTWFFSWASFKSKFFSFPSFSKKTELKKAGNKAPSCSKLYDFAIFLFHFGGKNGCFNEEHISN